MADAPSQSTEAPLFLGLDIGGTKSACVIGDASGVVHDRVGWPSRAERGPEAMIAELLDHARPLVERWSPRAVGVSIGGPLDARRGVILGPPNLPGWDRVPLRDRVEAALGLPVHVEHDAAACALAEYRWGMGEGDADATLIYLTCGTGFGAGYVFAGRVHRGAGGGSPELGHVRLLNDGPVAFGKAGSAEALCAGSGLSRIAAWKLPQRWSADPPRGEELSILASQGDADAQAVLAFHARCVGRVCAALVDALRPDFIALGSLARYLGAVWVDGVRSVVHDEALPDAVAACRIAPAALGERLQDCSAFVPAVVAQVTR